MKNQGISLISLIITIIVIIILAAIVIFSGLGTPDSAQFSNFCSQVDNVYVAMMDAYGDLRVEHAVSGETRTNEQIYLEIATGTDHGQYVVMGNNATVGTANNAVPQGSGCQLIANGKDAKVKNYTDTNVSKDNENLLNMKLPKIRENDCAWYVTEEGKIFNATGYIYDDKTYFNASVFRVGQMAANKDNTESDRAQNIADAINANDSATQITVEDKA